MPTTDTPSNDPGLRALYAAAGFYALSAVALHLTLGLFHRTWLPIFFGGFVAWLALAAREYAPPRLRPPAADTALLLACAAGAWFWHDGAVLADARRVPALETFRAVPLAVAGLCALGLFLRDAWWPAALAVVAVVWSKTLIIQTSPVPFIDVFTSNTAAADHFLAGLNPYEQTYRDIYRGANDYRPGMVYWPAVLLWQSAARWGLGDIRWGFVAADAITAAALTATLARLGATARLALLVTLAWLLHPVAPFVFEQSWVDPLLVMSFALFACAVAHRRALLAGCALGLAVAFKQYGVFGAVVGLALAARTFDRRDTLRALAAAAVTFLAVTLPVAGANLRAFYEMTIAVPGRQLLRRDALSLLVYAADSLREPWPTAITLLAAGAATAAGAWWLYRHPRPGVAEWAAAAGIAYGALFFFGKQAFCNYYHFLAGFAVLQGGALLALAGAAPKASREPSIAREPVAVQGDRPRRRRRRR